MSSFAIRIHGRRGVSPILLCDLDDTLLDNDIELFLPQYLKVFARDVASFIDPDQFVKALLAGTKQAVANRQPDCTLRDVFDATFYPALGLDKSEFQAVEDRFYGQIFPTLRSLTKARPEAGTFVDGALAKGYRLVIATNPLFPETANLQRLAWAGLPVEKYPFELVTSIETFHFTKPDPVYYAEILARLGWPSEPVVMIGNDPVRDIQASRRLGLPAFWVTHQKDAPPNTEAPEAPSGRGRLEDVLPWLGNIPTESLQPDHSSVDAMLAILRSTPAALDSIARALHLELWSTRPRPGEWSFTEILCHLRDVDLEVNLPRVQAVIGESNPFLSGKDTDPWAEERKYITQNGRQALGQFFVGRKKLLETLERLEPSDWKRYARHAIFGPTSLAELVNIVAGHDRVHLQQVHQVLAEVSA
jgi:FMN phosphatase YigB (HAD superfamily)